jgi:hypothetical protein
MRAVSKTFSLTTLLGSIVLGSPFASADLGAPVSQAALDEQRGGDEEIVNNFIRITGEVTDNSATNVVTGANNITEGSFVNSSGITSVVQNTGANVLIQSATIVNVQFAEP